MSQVELDEIRVEPGEKKRTFVNVTARQPPTSVSIPITIINGSRDGPTLSVTAGVHGTEYAGVEAAIQVAKETDPRSLRGTLFVIPAMNWPALYSRVVGVCPIDSVEMFRAFPGDPHASITYAITSRIFSDIVLKSDFAIDLHGGEQIEAKTNRCCWYCDAGGESTRRASKRLAIAFGLPSILNGSVITVGREKWVGPTGTLLYEASAQDVPTIIAETGGEGKVEEEPVNDLKTGVRKALIHLGMLVGKVKPVKRPLELTDLTGLVAETDGMFYSKMKPPEKVVKNQSLGEIRDIAGDRVQELISPFNGIIHTQYSSPIVRKGEPIIWLVRKP